MRQCYLICLNGDCYRWVSFNISIYPLCLIQPENYIPLLLTRKYCNIYFMHNSCRNAWRCRGLWWQTNGPILIFHFLYFNSSKWGHQPPLVRQLLCLKSFFVYLRLHFSFTNMNMKGHRLIKRLKIKSKNPACNTISIFFFCLSVKHVCVFLLHQLWSHDGANHQKCIVYILRCCPSWMNQMVVRGDP